MNDKRERITSQPAPGCVRAGERLKASTVNGLINAIGYRTIREGLLQFRGGEATEDESKWSFGMIYNSTSYTVYAGKVQIKGVWYSVAEKTEDFAGTPVYLFVNFNRATGTGVVQQANSEQGNTTTNLFWTLAKFTGTAGVYSLDMRYHRGAIQIDLPL